MQVMGSLVFATSLPISLLIKNLWFFLAMIGLNGLSLAFSYSPIPPLVNSLIESKYSGAYLGTAAALLNVAWEAGSIIGPLWFTSVSEKAGFMWAFASYWIVQSAFCLYVAIHLLWWTKCRQKIESYQVQIDEK